ncbi:hypothetical protein LB507_004073, partial [Fusarium sp. FIESC RH6]
MRPTDLLRFLFSRPSKALPQPLLSPSLTSPRETLAVTPSIDCCWLRQHLNKSPFLWAYSLKQTPH